MPAVGWATRREPAAPNSARSSTSRQTSWTSHGSGAISHVSLYVLLFCSCFTDDILPTMEYACMTFDSCFVIWFSNHVSWKEVCGIYPRFTFRCIGTLLLKNVTDYHDQCLAIGAWPNDLIDNPKSSCYWSGHQPLLTLHERCIRWLKLRELCDPDRTASGHYQSSILLCIDIQHNAAHLQGVRPAVEIGYMYVDVLGLACAYIIILIYVFYQLVITKQISDMV